MCIQPTLVDGQEILHDCDTKSTIKSALLTSNALKYQQCHDSPFLQSPLLNLFGYLSSPASEDVLDGTFNPPVGTPHFAPLLLQHMQHPVTLPATSSSTPGVSNADHINSWKKAREYTTAGISGIHFGMYKAQARDQDLAQDDAAHCSIPF